MIDAPLPSLRPLHLRSKPTSDRVHVILVAFTVLRLGLIPPIIATFMMHPNVTAVFLSLFMVADLYDGVLARRFDADGPGRRALDSVTDRVAIDACLVGAWAAGVMPGFVLIGLLVRDLYCGALCAWMLRRYRVAIKADLLYRGLSFLIGVWALSAPFVTQSVRSGFAIVLLGLAIVVAADLTRGVRRIVRSPQGLSGQTIPAGVLRSRRGYLRTASQLQARAT